MQCPLWIVILLTIFFSVKFVFGKKKCYENLCTHDGIKYNKTKIEQLLKTNVRVDNTNSPVIEPAKETFSSKKKSTMGPTENMCVTKKVTTYPNLERKTGFPIINIPGKYEQKVIIELCRRADKPCKNPKMPDIFDVRLQGYKTACKQLYSNVRFLLVGPNNTLKYKSLPVPTACVCSYSKINYKEVTRGHRDVKKQI